MKISEYKTATGSDIAELDKQVNELIKHGFQPFGTPYCSTKDLAEKSQAFFQAMIRQQLGPLGPQ